jgi:plastocyanin
MLGRLLALAAMAVTASVLAAAPAGAATRQVTLKEGPIDIAAYSVKLGARGGIATPRLDGYITHMEADVVDVRTGRRLPIGRVMLHHIVFADQGPPGTPRTRPFYGDGEERATMDLPPGYGYRIHRGDRWSFVWMLMNHRPIADRAYIRYRMTVVTGRPLRGVIPVAWDASHLRQGLVYDVAGGGLPGSLDVRTMTRPIPVSGRLVAGLGHVHGGARDLSLSEPTCGGRRIYVSHPTWGLASHPFYNVRPVLHEPGPIDMSQFRSARGIPVVAGQPVTLTSRYDNSRPHTRVMGLLLAYLAPDPAVRTPCGPMPTDVETLRTRTAGRSRAPVKTIGIYDWRGAGRAARVAGPPGAFTRSDGDTSVRVAGFRFGPGNLSVPAGATVRWTFADPVLHNVTLASGPEGFSSDRLRSGATFAKTFTRPGTYRFFCELHPVGMVERVVVRPSGG